MGVCGHERVNKGEGGGGWIFVKQCGGEVGGVIVGVCVGVGVGVVCVCPWYHGPVLDSWSHYVR